MFYFIWKGSPSFMRVVFHVEGSNLLKRKTFIREGNRSFNGVIIGLEEFSFV